MFWEEEQEKVNDMFRLKEKVLREFSSGLVVRILGFPCHGLGSIPGWGTEIPQPCSAAKKKFKRMSSSKLAALSSLCFPAPLSRMGIQEQH